MAKSKAYLSFVILFAFLLSSALAHELQETSPKNPHLYNDEGNIFKHSNQASSHDLEINRRGGSSMPSFRHFVGHDYKTSRLEDVGSRRDGSTPVQPPPPTLSGAENPHLYNDEGNIFKHSNQASSRDLEINRRGGSSMPSFRHFVGHDYKTSRLEDVGARRDGSTPVQPPPPTLSGAENPHLYNDEGNIFKHSNQASSRDLEINRRGGSNMPSVRHFLGHDYKTSRLEEVGARRDGSTPVPPPPPTLSGAENPQLYNDQGNIFKHSNQASSRDLEINRRGGSSMPSFKHFVGHDYKTSRLEDVGARQDGSTPVPPPPPTLLENPQLYNDQGNIFKHSNQASSRDLEINRRGGSSMPSCKHFVGHDYKTSRLEDVGARQDGSTPVPPPPPTLLGAENPHLYNDEGNIFKHSNQASSRDLEINRRGGSNMPSVRHFLRHDYNTSRLEDVGARRDGSTPVQPPPPTLSGAENPHLYNDEGNIFKHSNQASSQDLEINRRGGSSMPSFKHFVGHDYKTSRLEDVGARQDGSTPVQPPPPTLSEVDELGEQKGYWNFPRAPRKTIHGIGSSHFSHSATYNPSNMEVTEPKNYVDASVMRHRNMVRPSEIDWRAFRAFQAKTFKTKNGGKIGNGGVPKMEDVGEETKN